VSRIVDNLWIKCANIVKLYTIIFVFLLFFYWLDFEFYSIYFLYVKASLTQILTKLASGFINPKQVVRISNFKKMPGFLEPGIVLKARSEVFWIPPVNVWCLLGDTEQGGTDNGSSGDVLLGIFLSDCRKSGFHFSGLRVQQGEAKFGIFDHRRLPRLPDVVNWRNSGGPVKPTVVLSGFALTRRARWAGSQERQNGEALVAWPMDCRCAVPKMRYILNGGDLAEWHHWVIPPATEKCLGGSLMEKLCFLSQEVHSRS
jgi:hypothetical protein